MAYTCTVYSYGCFSLAKVHLFEILSLYHSNYQSMAVEELITPQTVTHRWQREPIRIDLSNPLSISIWPVQNTASSDMDIVLHSNDCLVKGTDN